MVKLLKIIFSMVAGFILLVVILALVLPRIIDPNQYKPEIEAAVNEYTGRVFSISGNLELSVFPWLGLSTGRLSLSNPVTFDDKPFVEIEGSNIEVRVLPLLSKKIEINRIVLKGLSLYLEKNRQGIGNWGNLAGAGNAGGKIGGTFLAALTVGGLSLENAQILWKDRQKNKSLEIKSINLSADQLILNEPARIRLAFSVHNHQPVFTEKIVLTMDLLIDQKLERIELKKARMESVGEGEIFPEGGLAAILNADIIYNRNLSNIESKFWLNSGDLNIKAEISGRNLNTKPLFTGPVVVPKFNAIHWLKELRQNIPSLQDPTSLESVALKFDLTANPITAELAGIELQLDETEATGSVSIKNFDTPVVRFNLDVDELNVDRYLPAKEFGDRQTGQNKRLPPVTTPSAAILEGARLFPLEVLRLLDAEGTVSIGLLTINDIQLQELDLKLSARQGIIESRQEAKNLYQGNYSGGINMNLLNPMPEMQLYEQLSNVNIASMLKDFQGDAKMTGHISGTTKLQGFGYTRSELKSSLNGEINFILTDGIIRGFDLEKLIENGQFILTGSEKPRISEHDRTEYSEIKGTVKIVNGLATNDDFLAQSPTLRVDGNGSADLPSGRLDYKVTAKVIREKASVTETEEKQDIPMIINVVGTFQKPSFTLMIDEMIPEKKQKELLDNVEKKFGSDVKDLLEQWF